MIRGVFSTILYVLACAAMALCILVLLLTATFLVPSVALALGTAPVALALTAALPAPLAFWGVLSCPLGGVFRTDFVIVAVVLLVAAKILRKIARAL